MISKFYNKFKNGKKSFIFSDLFINKDFISARK